MTKQIPILVPLKSAESPTNDQELRILLRSIDKHVTGLSKIYIMTTRKPKWLVENDRLEVVDLADPPLGKDAVIIFKTLMCLKRKQITGDFCWTADDNVFMQPIDITTIPPIHNHRPNSIFYKEPQTIWRKRVRNTLEWAKKRGIELEHNMEPHCPQIFNADKIIANAKDAEWQDEIGLTIYTYFRVITDTWRDSQDQLKWKQTYELPMEEIRTMAKEEFCTLPFLGYSDPAVQAGMLDRLQEIFCIPSEWEEQA